MALETKCLTPDAIFSTNIGSKHISLRVTLPFELDVSKEEAEILERLLHNQIEIALRPYFSNQQS